MDETKACELPVLQRIMVVPSLIQERINSVKQKKESLIKLTRHIYKIDSIVRSIVISYKYNLNIGFFGG